MKTKQLVLMAFFAALTAVCAQISIPIPGSPVPLSLSIVAVYLTGAMLPGKYGAITQVIYLLLGAVGVPVYAGFRAGIGTLFGPTGGYLIAYPFMALIIGWAGSRFGRTSWWKNLLSMALSLVCCYTIGTIWLAAVTQVGILAALSSGVIPFLPLDAVKLALCAWLGVLLNHAARTAGLQAS